LDWWDPSRGRRRLQGERCGRRHDHGSRGPDQGKGDIGEDDSDSSREQDREPDVAQVQQNDEVDDPVPQRAEDDDNHPRVESSPLRPYEYRWTRGQRPWHRLGLRRRLGRRLHLLHLRNFQQRAAADATHSR
jgi:hypothetical protein